MTTDRAPVPEGLLEVVCDLASITTRAQALQELPGLLHRVADQTGAVACQLDTRRDPSLWRTACSVAYPDVASRHLGGDFIRSADGRRVLASDSYLRIGPDDPFRFRCSRHFQDILSPAGFDDGISMTVRDPDRDVVAMLHLSAESDRDFRQDAIRVLPSVGRAFARLSSLAAAPDWDLTLPPDFSAVELEGRCTVRPVPGRGPVPVAVEGTLLALVDTVRSKRLGSTTFLHRDGGRLLEVRVACPAGLNPLRSCVVGTRPAGSTLGLTVRQLEVLTAVATGACNRVIAAELCLTPRTVAAHVEVILKRLGVESRAGAAVRAVLSGALLPSADPASVRYLGRLTALPADAADRTPALAASSKTGISTDAEGARAG